MIRFIKFICTFLKCLVKHLKYHRGMYIGKSVKIERGNIILNKNVSIRPFVDVFCKSIIIGENSDIGTRNRLCGTIIIGKNVLIGPDNLIASNTHNYEDINIPIISQGAREIIKNQNVGLRIGDDSWIGTHCAIVGDISIGKHCVVGANSVLTRNIPDYCVVVGNPAKIIKRYNFEKNLWEKVKYNE